MLPLFSSADIFARVCVWCSACVVHAISVMRSAPYHTGCVSKYTISILKIVPHSTKQKKNRKTNIVTDCTVQPKYLRQIHSQNHMVLYLNLNPFGLAMIQKLNNMCKVFAYSPLCLTPCLHTTQTHINLFNCMVVRHAS